MSRNQSILHVDRRANTEGISQNPGALERANDIQLFARSMAGDDDALMELFDRHHHRILMYSLKFVGNREQAEDLAQEMWEKVMRMREQPREVLSPVALMLTIVRNLCLNHLKANRRLSSLDDLPESSHPAAPSAERSHMEELVALALPKLPLPQREVLILHAYCDYRFEDIAEMLGESTGTVRMRASRARAQLGRIIVGMMEGDGSGSRTTDME